MTSAETTDIVKVALPGIVNEFRAREVAWGTRGQLIAVLTPSSAHVGYLTSAIFHSSGKIALYMERDGYKTDVTVKPDHVVYISSEKIEVSDGSH